MGEICGKNPEAELLKMENETTVVEPCSKLFDSNEKDNDDDDDDDDDDNTKGKKKLWKKVRYQLVEYNSLPAFLKDNEYIRGYYRAEWPIKQILLSIFSIHNETLNVWTHLLGFFLFLSLTIYTATNFPRVMDLHSLQNIPHVLKRAELHKIQAELKTSMPSLSGWQWQSVVELLSNCLPERFSGGNYTDICLLRSVSDDVANLIAPLMTTPITRWPFFAFLGGAMFCLLASSTCHLLSCHSERMSYIMLRLDYAGIAALIATSFYPPVYYSFMCDPFFCNLYLGFITMFGMITILVSLLPFFQKPEFRSTRATLFFAMGFSGALPVFHKLFLFWDQPEALLTTGYEVLMGVFYGIGAVIYATRVPERWMPGKFDLAGHSHQIFHVLVLAGAYTHYHAGLVYLRWRDLEGCR